MPSDQEKIPLSVVRKLPYKTLMRFINKAKKHLKNDEVMQKIFKDYDVDISEIDFIPTYFKNMEVSGKTDHGIVYLNFRLLCDGNFSKDYSYLIHEYTHWLQQCCGDKPTKGADDGDYLSNPFEQEGFANQIEYIANTEGKEEAENYVEDLLDHHDKDGEEKEELKDTLMSKADLWYHKYNLNQ